MRIYYKNVLLPKDYIENIVHTKKVIFCWVRFIYALELVGKLNMQAFSKCYFDHVRLNKSKIVDILRLCMC